ncbi:hypothetical protein EBZ38_08920 [bacterium]|nr:hypothetical protein [bacterium]NDD84376.1 hypothetical protein [bacterium]NDG19016.1 hypothetical protein [Betaproteobacteria bacterium]
MADVNLQINPYIGYEGRIFMGGYTDALDTTLTHLTLNKWSRESEASEIDVPTFDMPQDPAKNFTMPAVPGMQKHYFNFSGNFDRDLNPHLTAGANVDTGGWCGGFFGLSQTVGHFFFGFYQKLGSGTDNSTQTGISDFSGRIRCMITPRPPVAAVTDLADLATINALSASVAPVGSVRTVTAANVKTYYLRVSVTGKTAFGGKTVPVTAKNGSSPGGWIKVYVD